MNYFRTTRTATYGFLSAIPLFLIYEILILLVNPNKNFQVRVGADIWIKRFLSSLGVQGHSMLILITMILGIIIFYHERKKNIELKFRYFFLLFFESIFHSILLALLISRMVSYIAGTLDLQNFHSLQISSIDPRDHFWLQIALSIGAGLYEELFFRVFLVSGFYFIFKNILPGSSYNSFCIAAILAALCFSGVHYLGPLGDSFTIPSFIFRFLFGLAFNILYILRGFGVVAWAHSMYDVLLTIKLGS